MKQNNMRKQIQFNHESIKDNILCSKKSTINIKFNQFQASRYAKSHICEHQLNR